MAIRLLTREAAPLSSSGGKGNKRASEIKLNDTLLADKMMVKSNNYSETLRRDEGELCHLLHIPTRECQT